MFIEANSFNVGIDLGQDQSLCEGETFNLQIENEETIATRWFFENQLINDTEDNILVTQDSFGSGLYSVEVVLLSGCTAEDQVNIFFNVF